MDASTKIRELEARLAASQKIIDRFPEVLTLLELGFMKELALEAIVKNNTMNNKRSLW
jgi:hypothetical protein